MTTLLLIEDHAPLRRNLRDILSLAGYRVLEAATGPKGLQAAREQKPDLVLCDIMLKGSSCVRRFLVTRSLIATVELFQFVGLESSM